MTPTEALAVLDLALHTMCDVVADDIYAHPNKADVDRLRQARATFAAVMADAERYRFLKDNGIIRVFPVSSGMMSRGGSRILADTKDWLPGDFTYVIDEVTRDVDTAIDAAIAAMRGTT